MSDNMRVLLVGPGAMGRAYTKVLLAQGVRPIVIGRGESSAKTFEEEFKIPVVCGGLDGALKNLTVIPSHAIVASTITDLAANALSLIRAGVKNILVEKPAGINYAQVKLVADAAQTFGAKVYVAYNRRFYAAVDKALEIIREDGGVTSFNFEFTEWSNVCEKASARYDEEYRESWFIANSTHVVDLAFFLGGEPAEMSCYTKGGLPWHKTGCVYSGAGVSKTGALFSYQANWAAPGRWGVEVLTAKHRLYFRPMEKLAIQELNSVAVNPADVDYSIDMEFKAGLFRQVDSFLDGNGANRLIPITQHLRHMVYYAKIEGKCLDNRKVFDR